jgi:hypothetical protein
MRRRDAPQPTDGSGPPTAAPDRRPPEQADQRQAREEAPEVRQERDVARPAAGEGEDCCSRTAGPPRSPARPWPAPESSGRSSRRPRRSRSARAGAAGGTRRASPRRLRWRRPSGAPTRGPEGTGRPRPRPRRRGRSPGTARVPSSPRRPSEDPEVQHVPADVEQSPVNEHRGEDREDRRRRAGQGRVHPRRTDVAEPARDQPELDHELLVEAPPDRGMAGSRRVEPQEELV